MREATVTLLGLAMSVAMRPAVAEASSDIRDYDLLVTSAAAAKGSMRDGVYRFDAATGRLEGAFGCGAEIRDPRGIRLAPDRSFVLVNNGDDRILKFEAGSGKFLGSLSFRPGLNPGGGKFGWDGRYYVGSRSEKSIVAFDVAGEREPSIFVSGSFVKFPRGLAASASGAMYVASGTHPTTGEGQNTILRFDRNGRLDESFKVNDPGLSPLDIEVSPMAICCRRARFRSEMRTRSRQFGNTTSRLESWSAFLTPVGVQMGSAFPSCRAGSRLVRMARSIRPARTTSSDMIFKLDVSIVWSSRARTFTCNRSSSFRNFRRPAANRRTALRHRRTKNADAFRQPKDWRHGYPQSGGYGGMIPAPLTIRRLRKALQPSSAIGRQTCRAPHRPDAALPAMHSGGLRKSPISMLRHGLNLDLDRNERALEGG